MTTLTPSGRMRRHTPRPDQEEASRAAARELQQPGTRALCVSACGTGKTFTSILTAEKLHAARILVVVPTLDLVAQTAIAWRAAGREEDMLLVCSLHAARHRDLSSLGVQSASDATELATHLAARRHLTVFTTYDSLTKIKDAHAADRAAAPFDLAVMDEAHRIAGSPDKTWAIIHDPAAIRAHRRLYMTATPRDFTLHDDDTAAPGPAANSTLNPTLYGRVVHEFPLARAVADGVLADYRVLVPTITDNDLRRRLNHHGGANTPHSTAALRTSALHLAVLKAMTDYGLRRVLVYFTLREDARKFTAEFPHTLNALRRTAPELLPAITPDCFYVHGDLSPEDRHRAFQRFGDSDCAVMTNARLIAEGIDIPSVDAVAFADPTRSVVRCVQALGRALRQPAGAGKIASLIVPVYVPPSADPADLRGTPYEPVWAIAAALATHDHRITERLPHRPPPGGTPRPSPRARSVLSRWHFDYTASPDAIARAIDLKAFTPAGDATRGRHEGYAAAEAFHAQFHHLDVPGDYLDPSGYHLGRFITRMRDDYRAGHLENARITGLEALGMIWDRHAAAWRSQLLLVRDYHATHGHLAIPVTEPGGLFLAEQRSLASRGLLDAARRADLARIDPTWLLPYGPDWHRKYHTVRAHLAAGHDVDGLRGDTVIGTMKAGPWLHRQFTRWDELEDGQRALLTSLGLTPQTNPLRQFTRRRTFEEAVHLLKVFLARHRRAPTAREHIEINGEVVKIGSWFSKARAKKRKGELPADHDELISRLFEGDWTTDPARPANAQTENRERSLKPREA